MVAVTPPAVLDAPESGLKAVLYDGACLKRNRLVKPVAEADIGDHIPIQMHEQHEMISDHPIAKAVASHRARKTRDAKTDLLERPGKETVHFITPSAPAPDDQLVKNALDIEIERLAQKHVEILVGNVFEVAAVNSNERVEIDPRRARECDAVKIGRQLHESPQSRVTRVSKFTRARS